ncbi:pectate lyase [Physcomitrium patens]|uniref:Pectate lyase n=1 Tax=Physcomitrium patens TaxID=3218 RepID=A0A2K1KT98_PHYPA|nr:pectate lyase-like [Physcomitrium patens]PNR56976.1 hypothetical protein PHYPA_003969 [Physcomitrium patens]|eukprot:XP_024370179.1 pectate lyase-like [Physcomitrella patens]
MVSGRVASLLTVLIVLASQWKSPHARSMPVDFDNQEYVPTDQEYPEFPQNTGSNAQSDTPVFAAQTGDAFEYNSNNGNYDANNWDAETFASEDLVASPSQAAQSNADAATEGELSYDVFIDFPESVREPPSTSFADDNVYHSKAAYMNDEVFYDTSAADIIYKASDDGLSLATADLNATDADDMLASLAKAMGGCGTGNPIDDCWRCDPNWRSHRQALSNCATGFGRNAIGGKNGPIYTVTNNGDDAKNPQPGTLRYGVTRNGPLWIIFAKSMTIQLKGELFISAYKTVDGRGAEVHIVGGSQISILRTNNVILHGLHIHDIRPSGPTTIRVSPSKVIRRNKSEGDGLHIWGSRDVWIDHCYLAKATDGLIDVTRGSTMVTISNCFLEQHDKTMLLGADPDHTEDRNMRVTVAFNKFGPGLVQRLPRCRFGVFHVLNNDYSAGWGKYAIGGSEDPTILSQGNRFNPAGKKEVTQRINDGGSSYGGWQRWNWASSGDIFLGGSYFTGSGARATSASVYAKAYSTSSRPAHMVPAITRSAGPLKL